jgi:hypothetical protein
MSFLGQQENSTLTRISFAVLLLFCGVWEQAEAQSGRRARKPQPAVEPIPLPAPTPASPHPVNFLSQPVRLLIGRQPTSRRLQSEDAIFATFINRLNQFGNVSGTSLGDVKRKQAIERAKTETENFVVLVSFSIDSFQNGTIILNSPDLQIEYAVYEPVTGKKRIEGKVYFQSIGGGRMRRGEWPNGTPIKITAEAAGIEVAEHVHDWLRLNEIKKRQMKK